MSDSSEPVIYQLKVVLLGISPMIWRRLLVKSNSTSEDLHYILQIAMGWEDIHLHHFIIHGKQYGITQPGGIGFSDHAREVKLATLEFRVKERFIYEYDFSIHPAMGAWRYWWRHEIRVEAILTAQTNQIYPVCVAGKGVCPPEDCSGPYGFMEKKQDYSVRHLLERFSSMLEDGDWAGHWEELSELSPWLLVHQNRFDRHQVNRRLQQYVLGNYERPLEQQEIV